MKNLTASSCATNMDDQKLLGFIMPGTPQAVVERYRRLPRAAQELDFGPYEDNLVVLDTETTGFSLNHDELTQIAAAKVSRGKIVDWYVTFVNPGKPIPEDVAYLTHIYDEDVADAPSPQEALARLVEFVGDSVVVAHNAEFDRNFTTKHPEGYPLLQNVWLDSLDMARIALPRLKSHRLIDLVTAFGAPLSTHRADDDVAATCALLRILLAGIAAMPPSLVKAIAGMATREQWETSTVFQYFAERNEQSASCGGEEDEAASAKDGSFSLKKLRNARSRAMEWTAKRDAEAVSQSDAEELLFPSSDEISQAFSAAGLVGSLYEDFEPRDEQVRMARAVALAFSCSENLVVEAGTGVGKSMAYLVPSALTALRNDVTVGVATKTNALLDQLVYQELPALADALSRAGASKRLTFAPLKGFSHYPCLRKIERAVAAGPSMKTVGNVEYSQAPALAALLSFIEQTDYDDIDNLKINYRVLPRWAITTTSRECLRRKCPFFGVSCFVHGARRRAEASHVVVTNHSLLFCDAAAEGGLLPPVRHWTLDEAHGAEAEARRAFSVELGADELNSLATRVSAANSSRNVFERAERTVVDARQDDDGTLFYSLTAKAKSLGGQFAVQESAFVSKMRDLLFFDSSKKSKSYEYVDLWLNDEIRRSEKFEGLVGCGKDLMGRAEKLVSACQELVGYLEGIESASAVQREIAAVALELKECIQAVELILLKNPEGYVYAATLCKKSERGGDKLEALPYSVGDLLGRTLYGTTFSTVLTSATLMVDGSFDAFTQAMGLDGSERSSCKTLQLDSSYDFDSNMTVYVANDIPEPNDPSYLKELQALLVDAHRAQGGSMLTLFTNRREMERCFEEVQPALKADDLRLVCQKWGVSVKGLRDDFVADKSLSLFALKSFWEGFDAPGSTLRGVIIPKLPFSKPTDPLSCERAARDDQAWRHYVLPSAVLEVKQAAGRLIRKADDKGILVLADRRLLTKSYGKTFLRSLPSQNIKVRSMREIVEDIRHAHANVR